MAFLPTVSSLTFSKKSVKLDPVWQNWLYWRLQSFKGYHKKLKPPSLAGKANGQGLSKSKVYELKKLPYFLNLLFRFQKYNI